MEQFILFMNVISPYLIAFVLFILLYRALILVGGAEIAVLERKYFGKNMAQGRVIALSNEIGIQARTLGPGLHLLIPFLYKAMKYAFTVIAENEVGVVESIDGDPIPPGKIFAKVVQGHNAFQDGETFLTNGGQKGPQIAILPPGTFRINPVLFHVRKKALTFIDRGKIGIVTSMDGEPIPPGRLLAHKAEGHTNYENGQAFLTNHGQKGPQIEILLPGTYRINTDLFHVEIQDASIIPANKVGLITALDGQALPEAEYVAKSVEGHNDFQDASKFLGAGGQRGPQFDVLRPGTYYINPLMFKVEIDDVAVVERGQVAVVVSNVGEEPPQIRSMIEELAKKEGAVPGTEQYRIIEKRYDTGIERYVVPKGFRGIQQEVAGPGIYYLNRRA